MIADGAVRAAGADSADRDSIREGKEKAKAVMAASGIVVGPAVFGPAVVETAPARDVADDQQPSRPVNGTHPSRKRSRSGSRITHRSAPAETTTPARPGVQDYLIDQFVTRELIHSLAICEQTSANKRMAIQMKEERDYYDQEVRQLRQTNPGAVFGRGYSGYGNGNTDDKARVVYPAHRKRIGNRRARGAEGGRQDNTQHTVTLWCVCVYGVKGGEERGGEGEWSGIVPEERGTEGREREREREERRGEERRWRRREKCDRWFVLRSVPSCGSA